MANALQKVVQKTSEVQLFYVLIVLLGCSKPG